LSKHREIFGDVMLEGEFDVEGSCWHSLGILRVIMFANFLSKMGQPAENVTASDVGVLEYSYENFVTNFGLWDGAESKDLPDQQMGLAKSFIEEVELWRRMDVGELDWFFEVVRDS
jgi:hypothetical protein